MGGVPAAVLRAGAGDSQDGPKCVLCHHSRSKLQLMVRGFGFADDFVRSGRCVDGCAKRRLENKRCEQDHCRPSFLCSTVKFAVADNQKTRRLQVRKVPHKGDPPDRALEWFVEATHEPGLYSVSCVRLPLRTLASETD